VWKSLSLRSPKAEEEFLRQTLFKTVISEEAGNALKEKIIQKEELVKI